MSIYDVNGEAMASDFSQFTGISENILDDTRISRPPLSGPISTVDMDANYYLDISGHKALCSNRAMRYVYFYDTNKTLISTEEPSGYYKSEPCLIPLTAKYCRITWWSVDASSASTYPACVNPTNAVTVYTSESEYPITDRREEVLPNIMLNAEMIYGDLKYANFSGNKNLLSFFKTLATRAANDARHCFRIANWNLYGANRGDANWDLVGDVLADNGIDICGFEEATYKTGSGSIANEHIGQHLIAKRPWQFTSCNSNVPDGTTHSPFSNRAMVSRFKVVESQEIPTYVDTGDNNNNRSFLYTKIALPRYSDAMGGLQYLAFYVIHPSATAASGSLSEKQTQEWQTLLTHLESNKCAFKIIVSDTNDWYFNSEGYPLHWALIENSGFISVNDGIPKTQTGANSVDESGNPTNDQSYDHNSLDNIFVTPNIHIKDWNVKSVWDMERMPNQTAISDHDLIYADLEFDYSDLVVPMRPMTEYIAVIQTLTHCTSSYIPTYDNPINMDRWNITDNFTATITADSGYTLSSVIVKVGGSDKTSLYYSNGVVSVPSSAMSAGDIVIVATAN